MEPILPTSNPLPPGDASAAEPPADSPPAVPDVQVLTQVGKAIVAQAAAGIAPPGIAGPPKSRPVWNVPAAIAAWIFPGLGHLLAGDIKRGLILAVCIGSLWTAGLWLGGISVIEARQSGGPLRPWFFGQMLMAPSLLVEYTHDRYRAQYQGLEPTPEPDGSPTLYSPAYGRPYEIGTLYTALAGMLNLLAIIDLIYREPVRKPAQAPLPTAA